MLIDTIIILFFTLVISYFITRDFFHPSCIVSGLWFVLVSLYQFTEHPLWNLSDRFSIALLCWVIPFCIISFFTSRRPLKLNKSTCNSLFNKKKFNVAYKLYILYVCTFVFLLLALSGGSFFRIRMLFLSSEIPTAITIMLYLSTLALIFVFYSIYYSNNISRLKFITIILGIFVVTIFKSNKTSILLLFVSILYLIKKKGKLNIKFLLSSVLVLTGFLIIITLNRADYDFTSDNAVLNYLYIYLLSPLTAFDGLINNEFYLDPGSKGSGTLAFFYKIFNVFGANLEIAQLGDWVEVPLRTNVFTVMRGFYLDGGMLGIFVMAIVMGGIYGIIYALQRKGHVLFILFYSAVYSGLFFQSFGDYFWYGLSTILQYYIFSLILVRGIRFGKVQLRNQKEFVNSEGNNGIDCK